MKSRVKAVALLCSTPMSKYDLASRAVCDQRTAQRALSALHADKLMHVASWVRCYHAWIPVYALGPGRDARKPAPMTSTHRTRLRRKDPEVCIAEAMAKRAARFRKSITRLTFVELRKVDEFGHERLVDL